MVRPRLDWVQNPQCYASDVTQISSTPGTNSAAGILVHSKQIGLERYGSSIIGGELNAAAFPNHAKRQVIRAVRGIIVVRPVQSWSEGANRFFGARIGKFVENPETADIVVPPDYSMWEDLEPSQGPYVWADKRFLWERRLYAYYNMNAAGAIPWWTIVVNWSGREVLENDECLGIFFQNMPSAFEGGWLGGPIGVSTWLRTLCEVMPGTA